MNPAILRALARKLLVASLDAPADTLRRGVGAALVAEHAFETWEDVLGPGVGICEADVVLSTRSERALRRALWGDEGLSDIWKTPIDRIASQRNVGVNTVCEIAEWLCSVRGGVTTQVKQEAPRIPTSPIQDLTELGDSLGITLPSTALDFRTALGSALIQRKRMTWSEVLGPGVELHERYLEGLPTRAQRVLRDPEMKVLSIWGQPIAQLADFPTVGANTVTDVAEWLIRMRNAPPVQTSADEITDDLHIEDLVPRALKVLDGLKPLWATIYIARVLHAETQPTLQQVADAVGKTRERVRQLEGKVETQVAENLQREGALVRSWLADRIRRVDDFIKILGLDGRVAHLLVDEEIATPEPAAVMTLIRVSGATIKGPLIGTREAWASLSEVIDRLAPAYRIPLSTVRRRIADVVTEADPDIMATILEQAGLRATADGWAERRHTTLREQLDQTFDRAGRPLNRDDLVAMSGLNIEQVRGLLARPDTYLQVKKGQFAPASWGLPPYPGTENALAEALSARGGKSLVRELVDEVIEQWGCTESSCLIYLSSSPRFAKDGATVSFSNESDRPLPGGDPSRQRRVYDDLRGGLVWAIDVDEDVLRGSGRQIPISIAATLGLTTGKALTISAPGGPLTLRVSGPITATSSLRRLNEALDGRLGDRILLHAPRLDGHRFSLVRSGQGREGAGLLVGQGRIENSDELHRVLTKACWEDSVDLLAETLWDREELAILRALDIRETDPRPAVLDIEQFDQAIGTLNLSRGAVAQAISVPPQSLVPKAKERTVRLSSRTRTKLSRFLSDHLGVSTEMLFETLFVRGS